MQSPLQSRGPSISCSDMLLLCLSTLEKIRGWHLHADWTQHINDSLIRKITWIFCPGHAGVAGNERVDKLAGEAAISDNKVLLDP